MVEGLVAHFTSDSPFAQAEDDANHKKAKAAVTNRSLEKNNYQYKTSKKITVVASLKELSWTETAWRSQFLGNHTLPTVSFTQLC